MKEGRKEGGKEGRKKERRGEEMEERRRKGRKKRKEVRKEWRKVRYLCVQACTVVSLWNCTAENSVSARTAVIRSCE